MSHYIMREELNRIIMKNTEYLKEGWDYVLCDDEPVNEQNFIKIDINYRHLSVDLTAQTKYGRYLLLAGYAYTTVSELKEFDTGIKNPNIQGNEPLRNNYLELNYEYFEYTNLVESIKSQEENHLFLLPTMFLRIYLNNKNFPEIVQLRLEYLKDF